jgi:hypothetical protein
MVRSRQLAVSTRSGAVRLVVTAVERARDGDGTVHLCALHGVNGARPWRLTLADAIAALGSGRYVFEVEHQGQRRRVEVLGTDGATRLFAPTPQHGDLLDALPEWGDADVDATASRTRLREALAAGNAGA